MLYPLSYGRKASSRLDIARGNPIVALATGGADIIANWLRSWSRDWNLGLPSQKKVQKARARAKKVRRESARRVRNRTARSEARTLVSKARTTIDGEDMDAAAVAVGQAVKALDVVAGKGIIHKRNAGRRKSRLVARLNAGLAQEPAPES